MPCTPWAFTLGQTTSHTWYLKKIKYTYLACKHSPYIDMHLCINKCCSYYARLIDCFSCLPPLWLTEIKMPILESYYLYQILHGVLLIMQLATLLSMERNGKKWLNKNKDNYLLYCIMYNPWIAACHEYCKNSPDPITLWFLSALGRYNPNSLKGVANALHSS